jgi:hypothetical protein
MKRKIILMMFFLPVTIAVLAQKNADDTARWNGKWDPNDPACPCYKIQKQAEKEYQEMLENETDWQQKDRSAPLRSEMKLQKKENRKKEMERNRIRKKKKDKGKPVCPPI